MLKIILSYVYIYIYMSLLLVKTDDGNKDIESILDLELYLNEWIFRNVDR